MRIVSYHKNEVNLGASPEISFWTVSMRILDKQYHFHVLKNKKWAPKTGWYLVFYLFLSSFSDPYFRLEMVDFGGLKNKSELQKNDGIWVFIFIFFVNHDDICLKNGGYAILT